MEDQLLLLLESLEEKIASQQLKLVREHALHLAQNEEGGGVLF